MAKVAVIRNKLKRTERRKIPLGFPLGRGYRTFGKVGGSLEKKSDTCAASLVNAHDRIYPPKKKKKQKKKKERTAVRAD